MNELHEYLKRWQQAEPFDLYKNFHRLKEEDADLSYFVRGIEFKLGKQGLAVLMGDKKGTDLTGISLSFGLTEFDKKKVSFIPVLGLTFGTIEDQETFYYQMEDVKSNEKPNWVTSNYDGSSVVSVPFVDRVRNNWIETGSEQIADTLTSQSYFGLERVLIYQIEGAGLDFFISNRAFLTDLYVYPGVDLNKNSVKDISFIPVFGLKFESLQTLDSSTLFRKQGYGISWKVNDDDDDELFLDFARPCPPTCVPPPPPPPPGTGG